MIKQTRDVLVTDIWKHVGPDVPSYVRALRVCLERLPTEQLLEVSKMLAARYAMDAQSFAAVMGEIKSLLREAGSRLTDTEYTDFLNDVVAELETEIYALADNSRGNA